MNIENEYVKWTRTDDGWRAALKGDTFAAYKAGIAYALAQRTPATEPTKSLAREGE